MRLAGRFEHYTRAAALVLGLVVALTGTAAAAQAKRAVVPPPNGQDERAREPFDAEEAARAVVPGFSQARFFADSAEDFARALPERPGPWLVLSAGGSDGAFGAGLVSGLMAGGHAPDYAAVTGVSAGALVAVYAFAGPRYDDDMRRAFTTVTASDIFEAGGRGESLNDTWPFRELLEKRITAPLLADVAAEHRRGRRLFVVTTNLDAGRGVVWNMGAIAARGGAAALRLFRQILLASGSVPGLFPPVLIEASADGHRFHEMHADGAIVAPFYVAPPSYLTAGGHRGVPATALDVVVNGKLQRTFAVVTRDTSAILGRAISVALGTAITNALRATARAAQAQGVPFRLAHVGADFDAVARGPFDPDYMTALFESGRVRGAGEMPFGDWSDSAVAGAEPKMPENPKTPVTNASGADHVESDIPHPGPRDHGGMDVR